MEGRVSGEPEFVWVRRVMCAFFPLVFAGFFMMGAGCGGSGGGEGEGEEQDGSVVDPDGFVEIVDGMVEDGDGGGGEDVDGGVEEVEPRFLEIQLSAMVLARERDGGELIVVCNAYDLDEGNDPLDEPGNLEISVTGPDYQKDGDIYRFTERGEAVVTCSKSDWGLSVEERVVVTGKWIDPVFWTAGGYMEALLGAVRALRDSDGGDDADAIAAFENLKLAVEGLETIPPAGEVDVIRDFPGGVPSRDEIEEVFPPTDDDDAYEATISDIGDLLRDLRMVVDGMNPEDLDQEQVDEFASGANELSDHIEVLESLSPGPGVVMDTRVRVEELLLDEGVAIELALGRYIADMVSAQDEAIFPRFGFISLAMGMFNSSNIRIKLINKVYGKYLKALDTAFNTLAVGGLVDRIWPPQEGGPEITLIQGSASFSVICPDYETTIYGYRFNEIPGKNRFIIIGPNLTSAVESAWNLINTGEDETIWDIYDKLQDFLDEVEGLGASIRYGLDFYKDVLGPGEHGVFIGPFPDLNNTSLPQPVHIIPINYDAGRGPSYQSSLLGSC